MVNRQISSFMKSPHNVHLDSQGRELFLKPRPKDTYRASRRNAAKVVRRAADK